MLEMCVLWFEVASYVWTNVCSEWLQLVSGRVLCGGSMCICGSVSEGVLLIMKLYIPCCGGWCLGKQGSRPCATPLPPRMTKLVE